MLSYIIARKRLDSEYWDLMSPVMRREELLPLVFFITQPHCAFRYDGGLIQFMLQGEMRSGGQPGAL